MFAEELANTTNNRFSFDTALFKLCERMYQQGAEDGRMNNFWRHKKTGDLYRVIEDAAIDCTNTEEDKPMVVYVSAKREWPVFVREKNEFLDKFEEHK